MLYTSFFVAAIIALAKSQNTTCPDLGANFVDNSLDYAYGEAQFVVDIWNDGAFVLPFPIDDASGNAICHKGDIFGQSSTMYSCSSDNSMITKVSFAGGDCSGAVLSNYSWSSGSSPELNPAQLPNLVPLTGSGFTIPVGAGTGNLWDFSCAGEYAAAKLKIGLTCSSTVTVYGALGAGCMGTDEGTANLLVSCDADYGYLTTFYSYNESVSDFTEQNVCENSGMTNFVCNSYNASAEACGFLLFSETAGVNLYGQLDECSPYTATTPVMTESSAFIHSFSALLAFVTLFAVFVQ